MIDWSFYGVESNSQGRDELIARVEAKLGVSFPSDYLDLIRFNDDPIFEIGVFAYDGGTTCISDFLKFTDENEQFSILWYQDAGRIELPAGLVPIARDAGDFLICLDFSESSVPVKLYIPNENSCRFVADSFEQFVSSLQEYS